MAEKRNVKVRLWVLMVCAVLVWTIGSGAYRDLSADVEETYKGLKLFIDVIDLIEKNYVDEIDTKEVIPKAIQGMLQSLDPHSALLPPEAFEELQVDTKGEFGGIGIVITMRHNMVTVISPIEGTPAYRAGVKANDVIIKVDDTPTKGMMLWEAVRLMRGPKGVPVSLTILRNGEEKPLVFDLVRDIIPIVSVKHDWLSPGYGYIWITNFQENTGEELEKALKELKAGDKALKGLVLDLRDNPGGLLTQSIKVADVFLEKGTIVSIKGRSERHTKEYTAESDDGINSYPIVVLINGGSASAAEIVAGALKDNHRAILLGTTTFGKGSVQTVEPLRDGYGLKYTIARYYTPSGLSIQAQGIEPDILVKAGFREDSDEKNGPAYLKERDLKNHLEAEPNGKGEKSGQEKEEKVDTDDPQELEKDQPSRTENRHGPINIERLRHDFQVIRALDILVGYEILKTLPRN
jgi:carboxyl-terminal processing protease